MLMTCHFLPMPCMQPLFSPLGHTPACYRWTLLLPWLPQEWLASLELLMSPAPMLQVGYISPLELILTLARNIIKEAVESRQPCLFLYPMFPFSRCGALINE